MAANTIKNTKININAIKDFVKYLEHNYKEHAKQLKESDNYDDMANSLAFLQDYEKVSNKILEVIAEYDRQAGRF